VADIFFEQVDGSTFGAELEVVGNNTVRATQSIRTARRSDNPFLSPAVNLVDEYNGSEAIFNPDTLQLSLPDGRTLQLSVERGLDWVSDANGNALSITDTLIGTNRGQIVGIARDTQGRITGVQNAEGDKVSYQYGPGGDLRSVPPEPHGVLRSVGLIRRRITSHEQGWVTLLKP